MIHPSYNELIDAINANSEDDDNTMMLNSRYSLVLATSQRARQLIAGAKPLVKDKTKSGKPLSVAIEELYQGKVKILEAEEEEEESLAAGETIEELPEIEEVSEEEGSEEAILIEEEDEADPQ